MAVARHLAGELFGGGEVVAAVNGAGRLGFRVADVNDPNRDFVAFVVLVRLGAVEEYAAPSVGNVVGHCLEVRVVGVKPGDGDAGSGFGVHPVGECVCVSVHGEFLSMMGTQEFALIQSCLGAGCKVTVLPKMVVNLRAGRGTATTAAQSFTRSTRQI